MKWLMAGKQPGKKMSGFVIPAEAGIQLQMDSWSSQE
jgi:hypothetical protein